MRYRGSACTTCPPAVEIGASRQAGMRKKLKSLLPDHRVVAENRWLRPFAARLLHPRLWHLNRHSAAGAVSVGLFCGLIPGPLQMLGAALGALAFRVNLPLALFTTLYTNPLTIVPLYLVGYRIGYHLLSDERGFVPPPDFQPENMVAWTTAMRGWMLASAEPLALGLLTLAVGLAAAGYLVTQALWRAYLLRVWRHRQTRRPLRS